MIATKTPLTKIISEYVQIAIGILLASIGLKAFLLPNGFLDGGVTGIAILFNAVFGFNTSLLLVVWSVPFLILAYFTVSRQIILKSIISIMGLAVSIQLETFDIVTDDKLLVAIFGGLFLGLGLGITIRNGAVLDGSEILGIFLNDRYGIDIGRVILVFNIILFGITSTILSVESAMYSILAFLVTAKVTDGLIKGFEDFIGVMIVSRRHEDIQHAIIEQVGAGMTIYQGSGGYGSKGELHELKIIHTVVNRIDIKKIHRVIESVDPEAFVAEYDVNNIKGGVLRRYLDRKKEKQLAPNLVPRPTGSPSPAT